MTEKNTDKETRSGLSRRKFLRSTAGAGAVTFLATSNEAAPQTERTASSRNSILDAPTAHQIERDVGNTRPPAVVRAARRPGSDLMVQVLRNLDIEYVAANPGSSFEGLQESIINYGNPPGRTPNEKPEFISALHEESAVDMAHGYAKAEGRPMVALIHGTVGLMHASMAIYQAYHSQTPILLLAGRDDTFFLREHSANDMAGIVRSFTKWDAHPESLEEALTAIQEAYRQAITPPCAPALVILDTEIQKKEAGDMIVPDYEPPLIASISKTQARTIAKDLVAAVNPRISVGRLRTPEGIDRAVELVELVGASTETSATRNAMSFPQRHPSCGPGAYANYDFTLGLEAEGAQTSMQGPHIRTVEGRDPTSIDYGRIREPVVPITGPYAPPRPGENDIIADAQASLPDIIDEVRRLISPTRKRTIDARNEKHARANHKARISALETALEQRRKGWNGNPVSLARLYAELWPLIKDENWCLASPTIFSSRHHVHLWDHNKPYSYLGRHGAAGIGYGIGASTGAALAAKHRDRIVINIQCDGDLNFTPGSLWTAAHHRLPMLVVMHNNRAWHQELMYIEYMAGVRGRGMNRAHIGTTFRDPFISYSKMAEAYGIESEGPISDPSKLPAALQRGVDAVKQGRPYLIDVLTEPR